MNRSSWLFLLLAYCLTTNAQVVFKTPEHIPPISAMLSSYPWQEAYQRIFPDGYIIESYQRRAIDTSTVNENPRPAPDTTFVLQGWKHFNRVSDSVYRSDAFVSTKKSGMITYYHLMYTGEVVKCDKKGKPLESFLPEFKQEKIIRAGGDSIVEICTGRIRNKDTLYNARTRDTYIRNRLVKTTYESYNNTRSLHPDSVSLRIIQELEYPEPWTVRMKTVINVDQDFPLSAEERDYIYNNRNELICIRFDVNNYSALPQTEWRFMYEKGVCTQFQVWENAVRCTEYTIVRAQTAKEAKKLLRKNSK